MTRQGKRQRERDRQQRRAERRTSPAPAAPNGKPGSEVARSAVEALRGRVAETIDSSLSWHIARTLPRMGTRACEALREIEVTTYLPRASEIVVRRGRRVVRRTPLLMRTVFIGVRNEQHLQAARARPGVAEIVCYPGEDTTMQGNIAGLVMKPARLDPQALQEFVQALADGEIVQPVGVKVGQSVVVRDGPFANFPAIVEEILPHDRIKVAVSIFGRASPVELGIAQVQPI